MGFIGKIEAGWKALKIYRWYTGGGIERMDWQRLGSRKLWATIAASLGVTAAHVTGAPSEAVAGIAFIGLNYLGAQTAVDLSGGVRDWKSRKLWFSIGASVGIYILATLGMEPEIIETVKWFAITFVDGLAVVDIKKARKNGGK